MNARKGFPLFSVKHEGASIQFNSPLSGTVSKINQDLLTRLDEMDLTTYGNNWICVLDADNLDSEISDLKTGKAIVAFYQEDIQTLTSIIGKSDQGGDGDPVPLGKRRLSQVQFEGMDEETRHSVIARFFQR